MVLSNRLKTIADMIPEGKRVIDVGCDHAFLDIYLTQKGKNYCIASDINPNVLKKTKEIIASAGLADQIPVILSDGLENIKVEDSDVVVIAGMGTSTILHIVKNDLNNSFIIGSNNDIELLRRGMHQKGFVIQDEKVVLEKGIYYVLIKFQKGKAIYKEIDYLYGPILKRKKDLISISYFKYLKQKKEYVWKQLPESLPEKKKIEKEINLLETILDNRES